MIADALRKSILQTAIQGKLTEQLPEDGDARNLLDEIKAEKARLIKEGKIKKEKPLPEIKEDEIPFDIPENWCWVRLGDIVQINPRNKIGDDTPVSFIPMKLLDDGYSNSYSYEVRLWRHVKSSFTHFANNDIIVAKITPCFQNRKSAVMKDLLNGSGAGTTELHVLRPISDLIVSDYVLCLLKTEYFIGDGVLSMTGTAGQLRVGKEYIENLLCPLPPKGEQVRISGRIAVILPEIQELYVDEEKLEMIQKTFPQKMKDSLLQAAIQGKLTEQMEFDGDARELVADIQKEKARLIKEGKIRKEKALPEIKEDEIPFDIPESWCWVRFGEIADYKKGPFGSALKKDIFVPDSENSLKVYEQKNAIQKNADLGEYYITREYYEKKMSGFSVEPGDIIISCAGTIGESYILPNGIRPGIINQALMRVKLTGKINKAFYIICFGYAITQSDVQSKGTAIKNIPPFNVLKNLLMPLPPIDEQLRIIKQLSVIFNEINELEKDE